MAGKDYSGSENNKKRVDAIKSAQGGNGTEPTENNNEENVTSVGGIIPVSAETSVSKRRGRKKKSDDESVPMEQWTSKFEAYILEDIRICCPTLYKNLSTFIHDAVKEKYERERDVIQPAAKLIRENNERIAQLQALTAKNNKQ